MDERKRKLTKGDCLLLLAACQTRLLEKGEARYPRRGDFSDEEVGAIKAFLGPWPRALEAAGLKPPRADDRIERNREKRRRAKRARNAARRAKNRLKTGNADSCAENRAPTGAPSASEEE